MSAPHQPFFDLGTGLPVLGGILLAAAAPRRIRSGLAGLALLGWVPWIVSITPHSGRLYASLVPLYALAALALGEAWKVLAGMTTDKRVVRSVCFLVLILGAFVLRANYRDVWKWMENDGTDVVMARMAQAAPPGARIFLVPGAEVHPKGQEQLLERSGVQWWNGSATFYLGPGEAPPDVRIVVPTDQTAVRRKIETACPGRQWREVFSRQGDGPAKAWVWDRSWKAPDSLCKSIFKFQRVKPGGVERWFYPSGVMREARIALAVDYADQGDDPPPPDIGREWKCILQKK